MYDVESVKKAAVRLKNRVESHGGNGLRAIRDVLRRFMPFTDFPCVAMLHHNDYGAAIAAFDTAGGAVKPDLRPRPYPYRSYRSEKWGDFNMLVRTEIAAGKLKDRHVLRHWPLDGSVRLQHEGARYHVCYDNAGRRRPWVSV